MTYPQDPYSPQGEPPAQPNYGQPSGYDQSGYPQYDQPQSPPPSSPYPPQPGQGAPYDPYAAPPQYGQPYPYAYTAPKPTNTFAILSLVLAFIFPPAAIVLGHMAKKQIKQNQEDGDGLATAGLVLGYIFTVSTVLCCCGAVAVNGLAAAGAAAV